MLIFLRKHADYIVLIILTILLLVCILKQDNIVEGNEEKKETENESNTKSSEECILDEIPNIESIDLEECVNMDDNIDIRECGINLYVKLVKEYNYKIINDFRCKLKPVLEKYVVDNPDRKEDYETNFTLLYEDVNKNTKNNTVFRNVEKLLQKRQNAKMQMYSLIKNLYAVKNGYTMMSITKKDIAKIDKNILNDVVNVEATNNIKFDEFHNEIASVLFNITFSKIEENEERFIEKLSTPVKDESGYTILRKLRNIDVYGLKKATETHKMILKYDLELYRVMNGILEETTSTTGKVVRVNNKALENAQNIFGVSDSVNSIEVPTEMDL